MSNLEIVNKIIGPIRPVGNSEIDAERYENLKAMCELVNELVTQIDSVSYDFQDRQEASIKKASEYSTNFIDKTLGIC